MIKKEKVAQLNLFDLLETSQSKRKPMFDYYNQPKTVLNDSTIERLKKYSLDLYLEDLHNLGLKNTWDYICEFVISFGESNSFLCISNFGEMYEIGLAEQDKILKKKSGQYYTPDDVASVMSNWLLECEGDNVCDVACGTGKLILTYLELLGNEKAKKLIQDGKLYLYDFDHVALKICKTAIMIKYKINDGSCIHDIYCDFLDKNVTLPENSKVISNPPYAQIENIEDYWEHTDVLLDTKELYSTFMNKIFKQAKSTVIITPFSFVSGSKFYSLRKNMCEIGKGFIVSFDNVPGNIFCGRKHGIFNTNTANSVRASITVLIQSKDKGFRTTPLIRFKNEERSKLLINSVLENELDDEFQIVNETNECFKKVHKNLKDIYLSWTNSSSYSLKNLLSKEENEFIIDVPNTCRYYTTGSSKKLSRTGSITLYLKNEASYNFVYCLINSSFTYWWWRIFDGGITYPVSLINALPVPLNLLSEDDSKFFKEMTNLISSHEDEFKITKVNAGVVQENIKFPEEYRKKINDRILKILNIEKNSSVFDVVHANKYF